jgi:hypothetical protein
MHLGSKTAALNPKALRNVCQPTHASSGKPDLQLSVQDAFLALEFIQLSLKQCQFWVLAGRKSR